MKYVGIHSQQISNNGKSLLLLLLFPLFLLGTVYAFLICMNVLSEPYINWEEINYNARQSVPWVLGGVSLWFVIAYFSNTTLIKRATGAKPLERRDNPRVYNIVENLTMSCGMPMPKINIIDDPQLNAFASGIDNKSYTVTVTTGILNKLDDRELTGVIAHELSHIRNRDTRLLIISIIFVGVISTIFSLSARVLWNIFVYGGGRRNRNRNEKDSGLTVVIVMLVALVLSGIAYFFTLLTRYAISRKREYMADAGGAELSGDPLALASALRKISGDPGLNQVKQEDVAQLFICRPKPVKSGLASFTNSLFSTHPPIEKRIAYLEQF